MPACAICCILEIGFQANFVLVVNDYHYKHPNFKKDFFFFPVFSPDGSFCQTEEDPLKLIPDLMADPEKYKGGKDPFHTHNWLL